MVTQVFSLEEEEISIDIYICAIPETHFWFRFILVFHQEEGAESVA